MRLPTFRRPLMKPMLLVSLERMLVDLVTTLMYTFTVVLVPTFAVRKPL
jgi:hypothetical protein